MEEYEADFESEEEYLNHLNNKEEEEESSYDDEDDLSNSEEEPSSSPVKAALQMGRKNKYLTRESSPSTIDVNSPTNSSTSSAKTKNGKSKSCLIL